MVKYILDTMPFGTIVCPETLEDVVELCAILTNNGYDTAKIIGTGNLEDFCGSQIIIFPPTEDDPEPLIDLIDEMYQGDFEPLSFSDFKEKFVRNESEMFEPGQIVAYVPDGGKQLEQTTICKVVKFHEGSEMWELQRLPNPREIPLFTTTESLMTIDKYEEAILAGEPEPMKVDEPCPDEMSDEVSGGTCETKTCADKYSCIDVKCERRIPPVAAKLPDVENSGEQRETDGIDLRKILKGHEGEKFYSPVFGELQLNSANGSPLYFESALECCSFDINPDGSYVKGQDVCIWPSRELHHEYPCEPERAWRLWDKKVNTPKSYEQIARTILGHDVIGDLVTLNDRHYEKLKALNKLMIVRKYLEGDWTPDWDNGRKWFISTYGGQLVIQLGSQTHPCISPVYFSCHTNAQKALDILGEDTIRTALTQDF